MQPRKAQTIQLSGNNYAKVAERMKEFRTDFPKGKTATDHKYLDDGNVEFKAWVWKDKTDYLEILKETKDVDVARESADADGSAKKVIKGEKDFEKLQTIAVGRALAMLGYLSSGEIASFEEMDEFNSYKEEQKAEAIKRAIVSFKQAKTLDELRDAFIASGMMQEPTVVAAKDDRKEELTPAEEPSDADNQS